MISIETINIEQKDNLAIYNLNYPILKNLKCKDNIVDYINEVIYQDIICFKDVVKDDIDNFRINRNYLSYINTEYRVDFNRNDIISITLEFSQLSGLYNITYVNSYNYDINLGRQIKLKDIFKNNVDYIEILNKKLEAELKCRAKLYGEEFNQLENYSDKIIILEDSNFYIEEDGIVISFSSYELDQNISEVLEFKILFEECIDYLSYYILENIM